MFSKMSDPYAALRIADFRFFISARFCVTLAIQIQGVVVGLQVYFLTKDPLALGLIGLAEAIPSIVVSLYAGHVADIVSRKKIIVWCMTTLVLCSSLLLFFSTGVGSFLDTFGVIPIYSVIFISGVARGFLTPANFSFMPQLVPRELFPNAVTVSSTTWETASIAGPAVAGLLAAKFGITFAYSIDVFLTVIAMMLLFAVKSKPLPPESDQQGTVEKIKAGLNFVFSNKIVLAAISLDLFAVLFGGAVALLPIFAEEILHVGEVGFGALRAAPSIGALLMAFVLMHNPIKRNVGRLLLWCVAGFGLCMIAFGISTNFWLSLGLLIASGAFDCVSVIIRTTLLQTLTPENMKGRVSAVNNIFIGSSNEIGMFESGVAARALGVVASVVFGGCVTIGVVGTIAWLGKSLRRLQNVS
jgi:MFS family permease